VTTLDRATATTNAGVGWEAFASADPALADVVRARLRRDDLDEGLLATVRGDALPRINPVYLGFADGRLVTVALDGSAKLRDLREDGRYAVHAHQDPSAPHEVLVRGRAAELQGAVRDAVTGVWSFDVGPADGVFELRLEQVTIGERADADAWPPVYRSWRASRPSDPAEPSNTTT
jgi:hypothetical protein